MADNPKHSDQRCPNPYCEDGMVRCEGGVAKGVYRIPCRVCRGSDDLNSKHGYLPDTMRPTYDD